MSKWIPYPFYPDDMPVDISSAFKDEAPAGRHGFMKVEGDHFVFEDGHPARFWGVNFNGGACFPSFDYSEKVAARLRMTGVNLVRFHQLDAEWNTPNIFSFHKGERIGHTQTLHAESMKRLDYLIACLKKEGIYCYLDMLTYRNFKSGDGMENARWLEDAANPYNYYNRKLIEHQKKFIYDIWNHVNPYTGLAYKDDPVFVMSEIVNERDFFSRTGLLLEPYVTEFRELFAQWLKEKNIDFDAMSCDVNGEEEPLLSFKIELHCRYNREMYDYMRKVGVRIPITGTNMYVNGAVTKANHQTADYMDGHPYFYDWRWGETEKYCMQTAITDVRDSVFGNSCSLRDLTKPLFISEWDMPWPNAHRAESPVLCAAIGALQGWSGWAIHTYAYTARLDSSMPLGKEISSSSIGNVPYREGIFSVWNDPAKYGLFQHAALVCRRQDVREADEVYALQVDDLTNRHHVKAVAGASESVRLGVVFDNKAPEGAKLVSGDSLLLPEDAAEVASCTGEMWRSWKQHLGKIDSPRTKCVYGRLADNGEIGLNGMTVKCENDFAVIAASSLTDAALKDTDNVLLTAIGRAENTDMVMNGDKLENYGHAPTLVEVIEAEITMAFDNPNMKVWAVNAEGLYTGTVESKWADGKLTFTIGKTMPSMYYLIQAE